MYLRRVKNSYLHA